MSQPVFSVVMPSYNRSTMVLNSLQSVVGQLGNFPTEILIGDDSTDDTPMVIENFSKTLPPHVSISLHKENRRMGIADSRNWGLATAKGEYVVFLDTDDALVPDAFQHLAAFFADHSDISMYFGRIHPTSGRIASYVEELVNRPFSYQDLLSHEMIGEALIVCRRSVLLEPDSQFLSGVQGFESVLWLKILRRGHLAFLDSKPIRIYNDVTHDRNSSISISKPSHAEGHSTGYKKYFEEFGADLFKFNPQLFRKNLTKLIVYTKFSRKKDPPKEAVIKSMIKQHANVLWICKLTPGWVYRIAIPLFFKRNQ